jgi:hypothetical protein
MNMPKRASRHQAIRASRAAVVSGARAPGIICERLTKPTANAMAVEIRGTRISVSRWPN